MSDGKIVIDTDLDSSGLESGLKKLGSITTKGLKAATVAITGTATAMGGIATAAVKVGSDFEAQMSRVQAISGATGDEFEALREQAVELGADTAFSATEAAQGMENLAAAGFTTSEIMDAMPGMLNLAAAAGEDLASSADIAASTLRGFGLEASDAAHVADVLAENANRTNSSVSETGEAMKYVAPLARAAGISMEETAAAIGIMANAGIQGSQAGTTLRGALSRLSKPTDVMTQAMDELGVSFYDSEGKMLSLTDQVKMMRNAMKGMTDEQKNNYLVTLYGQEALSGMLALINEGEGSLSDLTKAYENCDGAAEEAAKTMQDNLKGAIEELSGSAETLGILFYDSVSGSLKDTVQTVNESVDDITDAFNDGGLNKAIKTAGDEFADLASEAAKHAPDMVDTAVDFIESFTSGILRNRGELLDSAEDVATTLAGGLARLLPDEMQRPVEKAVEAISDSLKSGGLKSAGDTFRRTFETAVDAVGTLANVALPILTDALDFAGNNMNHIVAITGAAAAAFLTYRTATTAVATATAIAEKAQQAWNLAMNANPAVLVASGIAAIVAALAIYSANFNQASVEQQQFNLEMDELNDKIDENREGLESLSASIQETSESIDSSAAPLERLRNKLDDAFDSTGKVREGSEELAQSILNQLNEAMGTEYSLTADGFIQNNEGVKQSLEQVSGAIDEYVSSLKQKALSEVVSNQYTEAIQQQAEAQETLNEAQEKYNAALENYAKVSAEYSQSHDYKALDEAKIRLNETRDALTSTTNAAAQADTTVTGLEGVMDTLGEGTPEAVQKAADAYAQLPVEAQKAGDGIVVAQQTIQTALASTDYSTMVEGFNLAVQQIEASGGEIPITLQNSIAAAIGKFSELSPEAQASAIEMMRDMMAGMESTVPEFAGVSTMSSEQILSTFSQYLVSSGAMSGIGASSAQALASGLVGSNLDGQLNDAARNALDGFISGFDDLDSETQEIWSQAWYGALQGLEGFEDLADPAEEGVDAFLESLADALEVHSPSRAVKDIFAQVWPGAVEGLSEGEDSLNEKGGNVISSFLTTIREGGLLEGAKQIGSNIINFFTGGMTSQKGNVDAASRNIAESSNVILGSMNTEETGFRKTEEYNAGVGSNKGEIDTTSREIADSSNQLLGYADTKGTGSRKSREYDTGVGSNKGKIDTTSRNIADSSNTILGSKDTRGTGSRKSSEYNAGVGSNKGVIDNTSKSIANSSNSNLGSADTWGTGSRKGSEYNSGLGSNSGSINSTGRSLSNTANSGMGSADTWGTGRNKGDEFNSGIGSADSWGTGRSKAQDANNGLGSVDAGNTGMNFVQGFINGFGWADVWSAAWNIGKKALSALSSAIKEGSPSRLTKISGKYFGQGFELGISGEEKNVGKASERLADAALNALDMSDISARMSEAMAFNTNRITRSFALESSSRIINEQHTDNTMHLSDEDIIRLAKEFGKVAGDAVADNVEGMAIKTNGREFGRVVREVER